MLQEGAASVLSVDVGTNQLHEKLRADPRVEVRENTDIRTITPELFVDDPDRAHGFGLIVADLSFISTRLLLPVFANVLASNGDVLVLVKPQFEAGRQEASKGRGIIRDPAIWTRVLHEFIDGAVDAGLLVADLAISPITGGRTAHGGNVEFLAHLHHLAPDPQY